MRFIFCDQMESTRVSRGVYICQVITLCLVLILHLVAICYAGWPCGALYSYACRRLAPMEVVLGLFATSSVLQLPAVILICKSMCGQSDSSETQWLRVGASTLLIISTVMSSSAVFYYYDIMPGKFWCHLMVGMGAGMAAVLAIAQIGID